MMSRSKHRSSVEVCADCGATDPSWASINRGLLLCAECCSVHRSLGRHISHVKSLRQGTWPPSLLAMVHASSAQNVNSIWEHSLLDTSAPKHLRKKPQPKDPLHPTKSEFILAKHLRLAYVLRARRDEPPSELGRQLHSAVRSASLDTAMRLLAQGADPNYYNQEKGTYCLHVACRAGQPAQTELLVAWGADPTARDQAGNTPSECARQGGHIELSSRMVELVYECVDRVVYFLTGARPEHTSGGQVYVPRPHDTHEMTDVAKAARGKLQLLPNHLFEELVMDIYDEIDRRETEAIWQTSATGLERNGVVFLPVNPALSAPRNQARQKLARLSAHEMAALLRDILHDATRRQHIASLHPASLSLSVKPVSLLCDEEPLYDSVASDDDYAAVAGDIQLSAIPRQAETVSTTYNASLPIETIDVAPSAVNTHPVSTHPVNTQPDIEVDALKKELDNRDSTINELKNQLKTLQTIVEQLTKENSVLKTNSIDDNNSNNSLTSQNELSLTESSEVQERGRSEEIEHRVLKSQRPVSMFETREGPKNNWQVTKHQPRTLSPLERSLTAGALESPSGGELPSRADVETAAEDVTRALTQLWTSVREQPGTLLHLPARADHITAAVTRLVALFPLQCEDREVNTTISRLRRSSQQVTTCCRGPPDLQTLRAAAYDLAHATKQLVTYFNTT